MFSSTVAISCSSQVKAKTCAARGIAEVNAALGTMASSSAGQSDQPSPRHHPVHGHPAQATQGEKDAMTANKEKINALQAQIQELHRSNAQAQINEPEFKRIRVVLDDHQTRILELQARMQEQQVLHTRQIAKQAEAMIKAQEDIRYLLERTRVPAGDQGARDHPRRSVFRAASGMSAGSPAPREDLTVDPRAHLSSKDQEPPQPVLLLRNTAVGTAQQRLARTRPPAGKDQAPAGSERSCGARSSEDAKDVFLRKLQIS